MKFLTVCEGGVCRSVSLASILRWEFGQDAVPLSGSKSGQPVLDMLSQWSDYIVIMWTPAAERILKRYAYKIRFFDIGPDVWMNPLHKDLMNLVGKKCEEWKNAGWVL